VVIAARHDQHEGDFMGRLQACVSLLGGLVKKHSLATELVVVEWNAKSDKEPLREVVEWHPDLPTRIIHVSPEVLATLTPRIKSPFAQYHAKNVGARRSLGEYVIATNPDVILGEGLIKWLARKPLRPNAFYRCVACLRCRRP
jgi:hypothetical protein